MILNLKFGMSYYIGKLSKELFIDELKFKIDFDVFPGLLFPTEF